MDSDAVKRLQTRCTTPAVHSTKPHSSSDGNADANAARSARASETYQSIEAELMTSQQDWPPVSRSSTGLAELMRLEAEAHAPPPTRAMAHVDDDGDDATSDIIVGDGSTRSKHSHKNGYSRFDVGSRRSRTVSEASYSSNSYAGAGGGGGGTAVNASRALGTERADSAEDAPLVGNDHMISTDASRDRNNVNNRSQMTAL